MNVLMHRAADDAPGAAQEADWTVGMAAERRSRLVCARPNCFISMLHAGKMGSCHSDEVNSDAPVMNAVVVP